MPIFGTFWRRAYVAIAAMTWSSLGLFALGHAVLSFLALGLAGEGGLTGSAVDFLYYYVTTATTVGYGDLSPVTSSGRIVGLLFVLPGSIALFTALLGKAVADLGAFWRRGMNGYGDYSTRTGHTVVLGWQGGRTRRLIDLLLADHPRDARIVLVAKALEQNPMPEELDYVRADSLSAPGGLERAGVIGAASIVIRGEDDDETLAATLAANALVPGTHTVAHFEDERAADLVGRQCPQVEAIGSLSAELLVRSARDPGASRMADLLFSAKSEDTAYSNPVETDAPLTYLDAFLGFKQHHGVTLVGLGDEAGRDVDLNCAPGRRLRRGERVFYIADARLSPPDVRWEEMTGIASALTPMAEKAA